MHGYMHVYHMHQDTKIGPTNRMSKRIFKLKISLSTVSENLPTHVSNWQAATYATGTRQINTAHLHYAQILIAILDGYSAI